MGRSTRSSFSFVWVSYFARLILTWSSSWSRPQCWEQEEDSFFNGRADIGQVNVDVSLWPLDAQHWPVCLSRRWGVVGWECKSKCGNSDVARDVSELG